MKIIKKIVIIVSLCIGVAMFDISSAEQLVVAQKVETYSLLDDANCVEETIFTHGLGGSAKQALYYHTANHTHAFISGGLIGFNYDDYQDTSLTCLGQTADIEKTICVVDQRIEAGKKVLKCVGVSRGAATWFNTAACKKFKDLVRNKDIKVVIVAESPFDHAKVPAARIIKNVLPESWVNSLLRPLQFKNYNPQGQQPINSIPYISKDIPILLVCSRADTLIPVSSTMRLYRRLRQLGYNRVHILVVDHGAHANILWGQDGQIYRDVVHAFYRHYGVEHNPEWAQAGQARFEKTQPVLRTGKSSSSLCELK